MVEEEIVEEDVGIEEVQPDRRRIFTDKSDPPISALYDHYKSGDLILDPIFQRRRVWDDTRASRLIESVLLEVPLPVFYLAESQDGSEEVIDGQQRLSAFFRFLDNEYPLRSLRAMQKLDGARYKDLDKPVQRKIRDYAVRTITFKKESDENLRFEVFERLNTGAVPLNAQELRNCVYRGPYNDLLIELSHNVDYMRLMGLTAPERRMRDVEFVLRFAAFYHATYLKYRPSMARFLNDDMRHFQSISSDEAERVRKAFKNSVALVWSLLGENAFKRFYRGDEKNRNGRWEERKFNASLFDILMYSLADSDKNVVMANLDNIREAFIALMADDLEFIESIELSTSSVKMVTRRFDRWRLTLESVMASAVKQPRCFGLLLKRELYDHSPTCAICGQHISTLDDAAVDHIEQYWLGGKTISENARLTHRYCNWARKRRE